MKDRDPVNVFIGDRIRTRRKDVGLTQADLASAIGLTYQMIQKYERGVSNITVPLLFRIADALDEDVVTFLPVPLPFPDTTRFDPEIRAAFDLLIRALAKYERVR